MNSVYAYVLWNTVHFFSKYHCMEMRHIMLWLKIRDLNRVQYLFHFLCSVSELSFLIMTHVYNVRNMFIFHFLWFYRKRILMGSSIFSYTCMRNRPVHCYCIWYTGMCGFFSFIAGSKSLIKISNDGFRFRIQTIFSRFIVCVTVILYSRN